VAGVPLEPGERLLWHRGQGTFHRGHDDAFAVSDRHAFLFIRGPRIRGRWVRLPLDGILSVDVAPAKPWQGLLDPLFYLAVAGLLVGQAWLFSKEGDWVAWAALAVIAAALAWVLSTFVKSVTGRTRMVIRTHDKRIAWVSYADTYADEKRYDRTLAVDFAKRLAQEGVPVGGPLA
jgi:hypothetical protein